MRSETSNPNSPLPTLCKSSLPPLRQGGHLSVSFAHFSHTWTSSYTAIMDVEIQFLHETFPGKGPKLLVDHIRRMGSGKAPFYSTTLSLVFDKLAEKTLARSVPSGSGLGKSIEIREIIVHSILPQVPTFTFPTSQSSGTASSSSQPPVPTPAPASPYISSNNQLVWLICNTCGGCASLGELYNGLQCPYCPATGGSKGRRPYMNCQLCGAPRSSLTNQCPHYRCQAQFR